MFEQPPPAAPRGSKAMPDAIRSSNNNDRGNTTAKPLTAGEPVTDAVHSGYPEAATKPPDLVESGKDMTKESPWGTPIGPSPALPDALPLTSPHGRERKDTW